MFGSGSTGIGEPLVNLSLSPPQGVHWGLQFVKVKVQFVSCLPACHGMQNADFQFSRRLLGIAETKSVLEATLLFLFTFSCFSRNCLGGCQGWPGKGEKVAENLGPQCLPI